MKYILPDRYTAGQLVYAYRFFRENPEATWVSQSNKWMGHEHSAEEWFDWFREKLTEKINRVLVFTGRGSKAERRRRILQDKIATCKWCGSKTGRRANEFCNRDCALSYRGF